MDSFSPETDTSYRPNSKVVAISGSILSPEEEQSKWLAESLDVVKQAMADLEYYISQEDFSQTIEGGSLTMADGAQGQGQGENKTMKNFYLILKTTTQMLDELRTSLLAPQTYYELYVAIFDRLQLFIQYCQDLIAHQCISLETLYETVQFTGALLPRLYLLIAAGTVYLTAMESATTSSSEEGDGTDSPLEIFLDLLEMSKGVQHPTRGLFLRHFLLTMMKGKLPGDYGYTAPVTDPETYYHTAHLLTINLREMNWLWIRMESKQYCRPTSLAAGAHSNLYSTNPSSPTMPGVSPTYTILNGSGSKGELEERVKETNKKNTLSDRNELKVLVGMNIVRISQLDGIDRELYTEKVLPNLIQIIIKYREPIAQQYLMEIIIQVFPDDFHLVTIETLLKALFNLSPNVDTVPIVRFLLNRLSKYIVGIYENASKGEVEKPEEGLSPEDPSLKHVFNNIMNCITSCEVNYDDTAPVEKLVKKTSALPPPTPIMLDHYLSILTEVALFTLPVDVAAAQYVKWANENKKKNTEEDPEKKDTVGEVGKVYKHTSALLGHAADRMEDGPRVTKAASLAAEKLVTTLFSTPPIANHISLLLEIDTAPRLIAMLPFLCRRQVAITLCETAIQFPLRRIETLDHAARFLELLDPLLTHQPDAPEDLRVIYPYDVQEQFVEEVHLVCRALHLFESKKDPLLFIKMLTGARKLLGLGGADRLPRTLPTLVSLYLQAVIDVKERIDSMEVEEGEEEGDEEEDKEAAAPAETKEKVGKEKKKGKKQKEGNKDEISALQKGIQKCFNHLHNGDGKGVLEVLSQEKPETALQLYLTAAQVADLCDLEDISYSLFVEVFPLYEKEITENVQQIQILYTMLNALLKVVHCPEENYDTLATKLCQYSSKLINKQDQSVMIARCGTLFTRKDLSEDTRARLLECVQRSLKLAGQVQGVVQLELYVDLLNTFLLFFKMAIIEGDVINEVLDRIREVSEKERVKEKEGNTPDEGEVRGTTNDTSKETNATYDRVRVSYRNTTKYIRSRQRVDPRWEDIEV